MKRIPTTLALLLALCLVNSVAGQNTKPEWLDGTWEGLAGWEHDTTNIQVQFIFNHEKPTYQVEYPVLGCRGRLNLIESDDEHARFSETIEEGMAPCHDLGQTLVFSELDDSGILHVQYLPSEVDGKVGFGQVEKREP